ncbi:unnamed protein product [Moneuplotes crassus]|uniref:Uncharacterized protein n=1 Tax=Euplotes crassus TaxID=5936 RepID=A0AAD1UB36_EUPCR|nr:unnamed protein product [Moneuplotes crassus]
MIKSKGKLYNFTINGNRCRRISNNKLKADRICWNSFDSTSKKKSLNKIPQDLPQTNDNTQNCTATAEGDNDFGEESPYIQSYQKNDPEMIREMSMVLQNHSRSFCPEVSRKEKLLRKQAGSDLKLENSCIAYKKPRRKVFSETMNIHYSPKVKKRQNLYDISSINQYKSIYKLVKSNEKQLKKIIVVPQKSKRSRKLSKVNTSSKPALVKNDDTFILRKHASMLRIDVQKEKGRNGRTTRKDTDVKLETKKAEIHKKLHEISHEYSDSTNVNSKGSSRNGSSRHKPSITRDNKVGDKNSNGASNVLNKNKRILHSLRDTRNIEFRDPRANKYASKTEEDMQLISLKAQEEKYKIISTRLRESNSAEKPQTRTRNRGKHTSFLSIINFKLGNNSFEKSAQKLKERETTILPENYSRVIRRNSREKTAILSAKDLILNRLQGLDQRRKNEETNIITETYEITNPDSDKDLPSIFNGILSMKSIKKKRANLRSK